MREATTSEHLSNAGRTRNLPKGVKTRPTRRSLARYAYFAECEDERRLPEIPLEPEGWTAAECFHVYETFGHLLPCREPVMLTRALNGKQWHGLTVTNCAEDYIGRLLFTAELKTNYPEWVRQDILGRARQLAERALGYVPKFVLTGEDFSAPDRPLNVANEDLRCPRPDDGRPHEQGPPEMNSLRNKPDKYHAAPKEKCRSR